MALDAPFGAAVVVRLDCTPTDNVGLVRRYKVQLRIIDQLVLHVLKNHITTTSYKSFLAHKHDFSFKDEKTGNVHYSGLILLRKMLEVSKPETIVEVRHLEKQLDEITLWSEHENNVCQLTTKMITILQEIHAKSGATSYTDQRFITNLFRALSSSPTEKFLLFVDQLKNQWIMEEITTSSDIIVKLDKMHKNMVGDGTWVTTNEKDTTIIALTSSFQEIWKRVGELAKRVSFSDDQKSGGNSKKNGGGKGNATDGSAKSTKTRCPEWQVTKKGSSLTHEGKMYCWCPHHHLKDGSINGLYMPAPHDHGAWAKAKAERVEKFKKTKRDKEGGKGSGTGSSSKKHKTDEKLKLALSDKLTQALVTQHHLSQTEADEVFNKAFQEAEAAQEN